MVVARRIGDYILEQAGIVMVLRRLGSKYLVEYPLDGYDVWKCHADGSHDKAVAFDVSAEVAAHYLTREE